MGTRKKQLETDADGHVEVGPPTEVYGRRKKRVKGIIRKENSVRKGVEETNRMNSCHVGFDEDLKNNAGEHGYKEGGESGEDRFINFNDNPLKRKSHFVASNVHKEIIMDEKKRISTKKYDVFLSIRSEDTRLNIMSHLYKALNEEKVKTFMLEKGDEISPALIEAIEDSH
ncbi:TMV resistance protein N, partial [Mucuna pruriens]